MAKLLKVIAVLAALVVVVIVGMNIFIKFYLTDARIKALVIPPLERALDRKVTIGNIGVSLFSGVVINDFAIKERDGKTDFVHSRVFRISYDLIPLLHKQLTVSEILLDSPTIILGRDRAGKFNFASLAVASAVTTGADTGKPAAITLPIALSVNQIRIKNAKITFRDSRKELPDADITADLRLKVHMGRDLDLKKLNFQGRLRARVDVAYGKTKSHAKIQADFNAQQINFTVDNVIGKEQIAVKGKVKNYMHKPDILFDVSSRELNLDDLVAMGAALPHKGKAAAERKSPASARAKTAIAASFPPGFYLHGVIRINKALYKKLTINNFVLPYKLRNGVLTVRGLAMKIAGGRIGSNIRLDLRRPEPVYRGDLQAQAVRLNALGRGLGYDIANIITGQLKANLNFGGAGFEPAVIKKTLSAKADFALTDGRIKKSKATELAATLVGLPALANIAFQDLSGNALVKDGRVIFSCVLHNDDLSVSTAGGSVDMTGRLNMPLAIRLSPRLTKKIRAGALSKFLADGQGNTRLNLKISGSYEQPRVTLDKKFIRKQAQRVVRKQLMRRLEKALLDKNGRKQSTPAAQLLRGLFGQ